MISWYNLYLGISLSANKFLPPTHSMKIKICESCLQFLIYSLAQYAKSIFICLHSVTNSIQHFQQVKLKVHLVIVPRVLLLQSPPYLVKCSCSSFVNMQSYTVYIADVNYHQITVHTVFISLVLATKGMCKLRVYFMQCLMASYIGFLYFCT